MQSVWDEEILIKSYEVDFNKKLKLNSLFNYMQEAAYNHACTLGAGYEDLASQSYFWVLSRVKIKVLQYPEWGDKIKLETWPKGINRLFALRDFIIRDIKGNEIALATTAWLVLDKKSMKPQRVQALQHTLPDNEGKYALDDGLAKIGYKNEFEFEVLRTAAYSDIDVNNHVNNAKYVEWILDCFPEESYLNKEIKSLQLNFISQTKLGNSVVLKRGNYNGNSSISYLEAVNEESSDRVFQSIIEWE